MRIWRIKMLCAIANRLIAAAIVIFVPCLSAFATSSLLLVGVGVGVGVGGGVAGGGYTGFGDLSGLPTIDDYFSAGHCYKSAYAGNVVDVSLAGTGAAVSTLGCSSGGTLVSKSGASLASTISTCGASTTTCVATQVYDQTGANACSGSTPCSVTAAFASAPYFVVANGTSTCGAGSSFLNSSAQFCFSLATGRNTWEAVNNLVLAQPIGMACAGVVASGAAQNDFLSDSGGSVSLYWSGSAIGMWSSGANTVAASTNAWMGMFGNASGATGSFVEVNNGAANASASGPATLQYLPVLGNIIGFLGECATTGTTSLTTANASSILANWASFYGGGIP